MITYEVVGFSEGFPQMAHLIFQQYDEVDHRRKTSDANPMVERYEALEEEGLHFMVIAKDEDRVVGYASLFIADSPHTQTKHVVSDLLYTLPETRGEGVGEEMIRLAAEEGKSRGAEHIMITLKNSVPHLKLVDKLGFFSYETIYSKCLIEGEAS